MKDIELMIEIFMHFRDAQIIGDIAHGYTFKANGLNYPTKPNANFATCLGDALKFFARHSKKDDHEGN